MTGLDFVVPTPRELETDSVDLAVPPERAWEIVRHADFGRLGLVRALFDLRTLPSRLSGNEPEEVHLGIDQLGSSKERPGFQILREDPPRELVVGAIGKVWKLEIPFVHVASAEEYAAFSEPGYVKVAWALRVRPLGERDSRVTMELRVDATDEQAWSAFTRYFMLIGPASKLIRKMLFASLAREHGSPTSLEDERSLPGDALLSDARGQLTHGITITAKPADIWPWLVQMGCRRGGFYSVDALDNDSVRSAREIHPELQDIHVGQVLPATPEGENGFEVLAIDPGRSLILGGLYDAAAHVQRPFSDPRPASYWQVTWAFVLEPLDERTTRLHVRARASFPDTGTFHAGWIKPVHAFMETAQLRHLAARAEGRIPRDDARDVAEGLSGAAIMAASFLTPFLREERSRWGVDEATAQRPYPGDERIPEPRWGWTHGIEIDAPASEVWGWIAQIGADRGGFYSYQWLENVAGCDLRNAETVRPEWAVKEGGSLLLHPRMPPLKVEAVSPGRWFLAHAGPDDAARASGKWIETTWLFLVEPLGESRCRFLSRYRCASSDDLVTRLSFGPTVVEPIGFAMDRRMLLGVKERAEKAFHARRPGELPV